MRGILVLMFFSLFNTAGGQSTHGVCAVSAAHPLAVEAGVEIFRKGGNAVDAAVAVHFALASVYQVAGNIAGGGFALIYSGSGEFMALDFRETSPERATERMYLDASGAPIKSASLEGALSVAIPGSVAGMKALHDSLGKLSWHDCILPAVKLAESHRLTAYMADQWNKYKSDIKRINGYLPEFLTEDTPLNDGDLMVQGELAHLLSRIAQFGPDSFYRGSFAEEMVFFLQSKGGIHMERDFQNYTPVWRKPHKTTYHEYTIYTMPLPSAGGIGLHQFCMQAELLNFKKVKPYSAEYAHYFAEMAKGIYADRNKYLGDPEAVNADSIDYIQSLEYLIDRVQHISPRRRTPAHSYGSAASGRIESFQTTHYCTADSSGMLVSVTTTLNSYFGSKLYFRGMFFNNEMDDFSTAPGHSNQFGLPYSEANKVRPSHRMLSSMSPTILVKDGKPLAALGTPGGSTIITNLFQVIDLYTRGWPLQDAINQKKLHAQWYPDELVVERGSISERNLGKLRKMGYKIRMIDQIGIFNAIQIQADGKMTPMADPLRRSNSAVGGF
ncbi:MAG: gamma-glutamyltransferase [Thermaurantimonas sp.]